MLSVASVNLGVPKSTRHSDVGVTGIDKRPVDRPVLIRPPDGQGGGLVGDAVCDIRSHGGPDQAVYAYAREDLDRWQARLGRPLPDGVFGENLTTRGLDVSAALIGERWRIGADLVLEVSFPRIPCRTFAGWLGITGWVDTFTDAATPGTYLRVIRPGLAGPGDQITVVSRPAHEVTVQLTFRAFTREPELLAGLLVADALPDDKKRRIHRRVTPVGRGN